MSSIINTGCLTQNLFNTEQAGYTTVYAIYFSRLILNVPTFENYNPVDVGIL